MALYPHRGDPGILDDIEPDPVQQGKILCDVLLLLPRGVIPEGDVMGPVQLVLNAPVSAYGVVNVLDVSLKA